ncbi:SRPBCC family protein [Niabella drilacis]|uniref:Activator of Hsp90 ATPase homolog 1-like protein n=1 Tax=Niabella drilacis (strain DSM 25811 / CCM 8410 / CCUG 62505 / LMG 26954 / E90) TaxID=1285928 RepID=A0A1G6JWZ6_NIADE|nr:SRPBCC domain-containing protein [Niabella drilacis]SDC22915.1 Activator of Hsp90 ATPase homolog 1-like protein [Niabella drilacis]
MMLGLLSEMEEAVIEKSIGINAGPDRVWKVLTVPALMLQWMGEPEMKLEVVTQWKVGLPLVIRGVHHLLFENRGIVLAADPGRRLQYSQLSSLSRLEEEDSNYSVFEFLLTPDGTQTRLSLTIKGFPADTIYRHLAFYWNTTVLKIKQVAESEAADALV